MVMEMIYHFYDTILYCDYYLKHVKRFRRHGLEREFESFIDAIDTAVELFTEYKVTKKTKKAMLSIVREEAGKLKQACKERGCSQLLRIVRDLEKYLKEEIDWLERSWKWKVRKTARRIAEKLKKLPKILLKPYNAYKAIDSFINSTSRDFAIEVSKRFNGLKAKIMYRLSYGFMWMLLRFTITSIFSLPVAFIIAYIYISYLALAYNVYATQLMMLPAEVMA
jgi:small-conductance mechanosensitive channel